MSCSYPKFNTKLELNGLNLVLLYLIIYIFLLVLWRVYHCSEIATVSDVLSCLNGSHTTLIKLT